MKTGSNIIVKCKKPYVDDLRVLPNNEKLDNYLSKRFKNLYKRTINSLMEYHNKNTGHKATMDDVHLYKSTYCGLSIDVYVITWVIFLLLYTFKKEQYG